MGIALTVLRLESTDQDGLSRSLSTRPGKSLEGAEDEPDAPYSELRFLNREGPVSEFQAIHISETREQSIRAFLLEQHASVWDTPPSLKRLPARRVSVAAGFQEIRRFRVTMDFRRREMYIYHRADVADALVRRFREAKAFVTERMHLDLRAIERVPGVETVYGAWKPRAGPVNTVGYFGPDVMKDPDVVMGRTKSMHVAFRDNDAVVDLYVSEDCRVGTRTKGLKERDILRIYRRLEAHLKKTVSVSIEGPLARPARPERKLF